MTGRSPLGIAAVALALGVAPATAGAQTFAAGSGDPREPGVESRDDIAGVTSEFHAARGTWSVTVRFFGPQTRSRSRVLHASLRLRDASGACAPPVASFYSSTATIGSGPVGRFAARGPAGNAKRSAKAHGAGRRELTLWMSDRRLLGQQPCALEGVRVGPPDQDDVTTDAAPSAAFQPAPALEDAVRPVALLSAAREPSLRVLGNGRVRGVSLGRAGEPGVSAVLELLHEGSRLGRVRIRRVPVEKMTQVDVPATRAGRRLLRRRVWTVLVRMTMTDRAGNRSVVQTLAPPGQGGGITALRP